MRRPEQRNPEVRVVDRRSVDLDGDGLAGPQLSAESENRVGGALPRRVRPDCSVDGEVDPKRVVDSSDGEFFACVPQERFPLRAGDAPDPDSAGAPVTATSRSTLATAPKPRATIEQGCRRGSDEAFATSAVYWSRLRR